MGTALIAPRLGNLPLRNCHSVGTSIKYYCGGVINQTHTAEQPLVVIFQLTSLSFNIFRKFFNGLYNGSPAVSAPFGPDSINLGKAASK